MIAVVDNPNKEKCIHCGERVGVCWQSKTLADGWCCEKCVRTGLKVGIEDRVFHTIDNMPIAKVVELSNVDETNVEVWQLVKLIMTEAE